MAMPPTIRPPVQKPPVPKGPRQPVGDAKFDVMRGLSFAVLSIGGLLLFVVVTALVARSIRGTPVGKQVGLDAPPLPYTVYADESQDTPLSSLVRLHIVVEGDLTEENLRQTLLDIYKEKRKGPFEYHPDDPNMVIFAYPDQERAESQNGLWVAKLDVDQGSEPKITIDKDLLKALKTPPINRFGLSEHQRRALIWEVEACQVAAQKEAERKYPRNARKQAEYMNNGAEGCVLHFAKKFHVTIEQYYKIEAEADTAKWPRPSD